MHIPILYRFFSNCKNENRENVSFYRVVYRDEPRSIDIAMYPTSLNRDNCTASLITLNRVTG